MVVGIALSLPKNCTPVVRFDTSRLSDLATTKPRVSQDWQTQIFVFNFSTNGFCYSLLLDVVWPGLDVNFTSVPLTTTCPPEAALLPDTDTDEEGIVITRAVEKGNASDMCKAVRWERVSTWSRKSISRVKWRISNYVWVRVSTSSHIWVRGSTSSHERVYQ